MKIVQFHFFMLLVDDFGVCIFIGFCIHLDLSCEEHCYRSCYKIGSYHFFFFFLKMFFKEVLLF